MLVLEILKNMQEKYKDIKKHLYSHHSNDFRWHFFPPLIDAFRSDY